MVMVNIHAGWWLQPDLENLIANCGSVHQLAWNILETTSHLLQHEYLAFEYRSEVQDFDMMAT
jgi:hypothetical protein